MQLFSFLKNWRIPFILKNYALVIFPPFKKKKLTQGEKVVGTFGPKPIFEFIRLEI
jgi:hypothetical protein